MSVQLQSTTIATLASQTSFTLTAGSADNDAYNGCLAVFTDQSTSTQKCFGYVSDYVGSSKTVTMVADPGIFTIATGDTVEIYTPATANIVFINGLAATATSIPTAVEIREEIDANSSKLFSIEEDTGSTLPTLMDTNKEEVISSIGTGTGTGSYTLTIGPFLNGSTGEPVDGMEILLTTGATRTSTILARKTTNSSGYVTMPGIDKPTSGDYHYYHTSLAGYESETGSPVGSADVTGEYSWSA